jgi:hypothetical protein
MTDLPSTAPGAPADPPSLRGTIQELYPGNADLTAIRDELAATANPTVAMLEQAWAAAAPHTAPLVGTMEALDIADDLATRPNLPRHLQIALARSGPPTSVARLAARTDLPRRVYMDLYRRAARQPTNLFQSGRLAAKKLLITLAGNPAFPTDRVYLLAANPLPQVRATVAARADLHPRTVHRLLTDPGKEYGTVREAVATNQHLPEELRVHAALLLHAPLTGYR